LSMSVIMARLRLGPTSANSGGGVQRKAGKQ
jgi:hypothetical protein